MHNDRSILERQIERVEVGEFTLERFHRRRTRKQRNQRIGTAMVALALAAAGIGGMARAFRSGPEPRAADRPSGRFVGTWTSTELDSPGISQTMTIRAADDSVHDIALHDESNWACSDHQTRTNHVDTPSTLTGTGRLEDATTLVVPSPVLACADGRGQLVNTGFAEEKGGTSYTLVLDLATDRLFDDLGVAWHRGATPKNGTDTTTHSSETGPGTFSFLYGEVTFDAAPPWGDHLESYLDPRIFWLIGGPDSGLSEDASIEILANPSPEASCTALPRVPASAEALVQAIRSDPDLEATVPVVERVGGIDALRLDVTPVPGASPCLGSGVPVVTVFGRQGWGGIGHGDLGRLYVLDLPGGSVRALAILITAPEAAFDKAVKAAEPVIDSFEFHTG